MSQQNNRRPPPNFPDEPPAVPLTPDEAKDRNTYVRDIVARIERYRAEGMPVSEIDTLVPEFKKSFPKLYETLTGPTYDRKSLLTMLFMLEKMGTGQLSQNDASVIVGQRMFDTYVKPQIDSEPPSRR